MLSRPLFRFGRFDLKHVAKAQRTKALQIQIRQWSPYGKTGQYVVFGQDHALVWAWDADRLSADLTTQKLKSSSTRVIPETLLHITLLSGLRLVECLDGVEGQLWQNQRIVHSRWWTEPPSLDDWLNFQRDAGIAPELDGGLPQVQKLTWLKRPWADTEDLTRGQGSVFRHETWVIRGMTALLLVFTVWSGVELIKMWQATLHSKIQLAELEQRAQPRLEARRKTLESLSRIETLQATNPYPTQLALMTAVALSLSPESAYLTEWDFRSGKLKITIASANKLTSGLLVKKLQDIGWFRNVQAGTSNDANTLTLTMETLMQSELTIAVATQAGVERMGKAGEPAKVSPKT